MTKKLTALRISEASKRKLLALAEQYGTQTTAIEIAIDRMYQEQMTQRTLRDWMLQNYDTLYCYVGTIWGDYTFEASGLGWVGLIDEKGVNKVMIDHPVYGGDDGYYVQGQDIHYRSGSLIDEKVLEKA